jgi:hypothetical protein
MYKPPVLRLVALIGSAILIDGTATSAQTVGAVQYPPPSIGEDAQPPPPARIVPQAVSPRRIEWGVSGSSSLPGNSPYRVIMPTGIDQPVPPIGVSPNPPATAGGN